MIYSTNIDKIIYISKYKITNIYIKMCISIYKGFYFKARRGYDDCKMMFLSIPYLKSIVELKIALKIKVGSSQYHAHLFILLFIFYHTYFY